MLVILPLYAQYPCSLVLMTKGIYGCPVSISWHRHIPFPQQQWLHLVPEAEVSVEIWQKLCCKSLTWLRLTNWLLYSSFSPMQLVRFCKFNQFEVSYECPILELCCSWQISFVLHRTPSFVQNLKFELCDLIMHHFSPSSAGFSV